MERENLKPGIIGSSKEAVKAAILLGFGKGCATSLKPLELSSVRPRASHIKKQGVVSDGQKDGCPNRKQNCVLRLFFLSR